MKRKNKHNKFAKLFCGTRGKRAKKKKRIVLKKTRVKNSVFRRKIQSRIKTPTFENKTRKLSKEKKHKKRNFSQREKIKI